MRFLEHRIGDPRILRLIRKWLKAGVMEDGAQYTSRNGDTQGAYHAMDTKANFEFEREIDLVVL